MARRIFVSFASRWEWTAFALLVGLLISGCGGDNAGSGISAAPFATGRFAGTVSNGATEIGTINFEIASDGRADGSLNVQSTGRAEAVDYVPPKGEYRITGKVEQSPSFTLFGTIQINARIEVTVNLPHEGKAGSFTLRVGNLSAASSGTGGIGGGANSGSSSGNTASTPRQEWSGSGTLTGQNVPPTGDPSSPPPTGNPSPQGKQEPTGVCRNLPMDTEALCLEIYAAQDSNAIQEDLQSVPTFCHYSSKENTAPRKFFDRVYYQSVSFEPTMRRRVLIYMSTTYELSAGKEFNELASSASSYECRLDYIEGAGSSPEIPSWVALGGKFRIEQLEGDKMRVRFDHVKFESNNVLAQGVFYADGEAVFRRDDPGD